MLKLEIAELMNQDNTMSTWAKKVKHNIEMSSEEKEMSQVVDAWTKEIGEGKCDAYQLSQYLVKTVEPEIYNAPSEIIDMIFDRGQVGEFDDFQVNEDAKNMLEAIESAKNGNVDRSFIDYKAVKPTWKHFQIETEVSMEKLRKGGYKTVADLQTMAVEAFNNKLFYTVFDIVDKAITSPSAQGIVSSGSLTMSAMDEMAFYLTDRGSNPVLLGLSSLLNPIYKMTGYQPFLSQNMLDVINRNGALGMYNGVTLAPISAAKKLANGSTLLPDKKLIGIADKIGELDMRGGMRVLQTPDNNREVIGLKFTGFEFGVAINKIDKVAKITIS